MKKYPVIYQGKEYEVRWDQEICCGIVLDSIITVYEVVPYTSFFMHKEKIKYKKLDTYYAHNLNELYDLNPNAEDLYIKQAEYSVLTFLQKIEKDKQQKALEETKKQKLKEWNGVIE
jgi:hypothetical protein